MIPAVVPSFRSPDDTSHQHRARTLHRFSLQFGSAQLTLPTAIVARPDTRPLFPLAIHCRLFCTFLTDPSRYTLPRFLGLFADLILPLPLSVPPCLRAYVHACSRNYASPRVGVPVYMCVREYVRACMRGRVCLYVRIYMCVCVYLSVVRVYVLSSVTQSVTFLVRAFSRSLHRCGSCTRESCRCSRQALPGRVSLSGNVPTEQPTLALTLCPFRGVLWREPRLCLSRSAVLSLAPSFSPSTTRRTPS